MANFHSRSNSLPAQSHSIVDDVQDQLCRLKSSEGATTSATFVCANLACLKDLHEGIDNLIQMPSFQQALSNEQGQRLINELLEGSLQLVDLCGISREIMHLTKESVQDLESSIRRNKVDMNAYVASRKKIQKMVKTCFKNFNQLSATIPDRDIDLKTIGIMLKETESLDLSILKSVLILLSGENERSSHRSRSFFSKLSKTSRVYSEAEQESGAQDLCSLNIIRTGKSMDNMTLKSILKQSEPTIQELEEGLESLFRNLVKTRVSLLNLLSN